ncbi:tetratricopeptide repeat protein [Campylobacter sp. MOP51]|uniref:tetratricopeptide repeat protein n=1 Tax=Campylobacter canis TaxID=3378588 RepID=UPI003C4DD35F
MTNFKNLAALFMGVALAYSAEISVFDAGNLDSSNPYGLTDGEKALLKNKQKVENLSRNMNDVESTLSGAQERIEGIQSIMDGMNSRITKVEKRLDELQGKVVGEEGGEGVSLESLRQYVEESRKIQEANNQKITKALKDLSALIDKINSNYVSKSELSKTGSKSTEKEQSSESKDSAGSSSKSDFTKQKIQDVATDAKKMFDAGKLDDAKDRYEFLITKNHKPAAANFYLGEISYQQKAYNNAIKYYQQSISLYDKADYTPKLLYHTAISFDKIGDTASANRFYKALKLGYPESKEAKASPDR